MKNSEQENCQETFEELIAPRPIFNYFIEERDSTIRYGRPASHTKAGRFYSYEEALEILNFTINAGNDG